MKNGKWKMKNVLCVCCVSMVAETIGGDPFKRKNRGAH